MAELINTARAERRALHFETVDEILREVDRIVAAERAGALRRTGNWTTGQIFGHLAAWIEYGYEGYPPGANPPWLVKVIAKLLKKTILYKPMRPGMKLGPRTPGGTFGTEALSSEEGARRLRAALGRLQRLEPVKYHSPALGPLTDDERVAINCRHAELHLGFLYP
jgi:hypothetical protein